MLLLKPKKQLTNNLISVMIIQVSTFDTTKYAAMAESADAHG